MSVVINGTTGIDAPGINAGNIVGQICFFAMNAAPSGFLACDGSAVSRATYSALFGLVGTTYGAGNGSTTFNLPDLRGEFIRGLDNGRGVDPARVHGSAQTDAFQGHHHDVKVSTTQVGNNGGGGVGTGNLRGDGLGTLAQAKDVASNGSNGSPRIASETRPRNIALLACIKF